LGDAELFCNQKPTGSGIYFLQNNTARNADTMTTCLEIGLEQQIDFILLQEPWISNDNTSSISHPAFDAILPERTDIRPRVAIYHRKLSRFNYCQRNDITSDSDLLVIDILGAGIQGLQLLNIYNEQSLEEGKTEWTVERALSGITPSKNSIIGGDFNAYHSWWNSETSLHGQMPS
jgi:hypothetical protein